MDQDTFSKTIGIIYDAAVSSEHWPAVLERLRVVFRGNAVATMLRDTATAKGRGIAVGDAAAPYGEYLDQWTGRNIISNRTRVWRSGAVETDQDILPKSELLCSEYYNDFMKRNNIHAVLRLSLGYEDGIWSGLSVTRPRHADEFDRGDIELGRALVPHLQRALNIAQRLRHSEIVSETMLDRLQHPLLILGSGNRLIHFNHAAAALLAQADGLIAVASTLHAATPALTGRLRALLANAAGEGRCGRTAGAMRLQRPSGKPELSLLAIPLRLSCEWLLPRQPSVLLSITDPQAALAVPANQLAELFGLTAAEARVAAELQAGLDIREIAERQGCSVNTIRVHLTRLLAKTDTNRQSELVGLLTRLPAFRADI